ncbi:MAG: PP2C family protein-serine/threonine phosphatase, partial [Planctomycetota bacterium]
LPPLVVGGGTVRPLGEARHLPLGVASGAHSSETTVIGTGQCLIVVTDGIPDMQNQAGEDFGLQRLRAALSREPIESAQAAVQNVIGAVTEFRQSLPARDDITMLALHRRRPREAEA